MMIHEHPLRILKHAKNSIWLLVFPVLRGVRSFSLDTDAFYTWVTGGWFDLLVLILILGAGYITWLFTWVRLGRNHIRLMQGIFVKRTTEIPYKNISAVTAQHNFYLRPFQAVRVYVDTDAGTLGTTDMSVMVRRDDFKKLQKKLPKIKHAEKKSFKFHPKWYRIVFFSFVFSSSLSGALYISGLVFNAGRAFMDLMREDLPGVYKVANDVSHNVSENAPVEIPPVVIVIVSAILGMWLLSFFSNLFRYYDFIMKKDEHIMRIVSGAFTRRVFHIMPRKINFLDLRQSFITKLFRISSLNISCSGYGKGKNELPVLLPVLTKKEVNDALEMLGFNKYLVKRTIKPEKMAFMTYIGVPFYTSLGILAAAWLAVGLFPQIAEIVPYAAVILEIPFVWLTIVKFYAFMTSGITVNDDFCCIRYSRFYAFHTIMADKSKLVKIQVFQDLIDKKIGRCRLDFYFSSEQTRIHKVKGLSVKDAQKIIEQFGVLKNTETIDDF